MGIIAASLKRNVFRFGLFSSMLVLVLACNLQIPVSQEGLSGTLQVESPADAQGSPLPRAWWQPPLRLTWQWQLSGTFDAVVDADVYDLDLYDADPQSLIELKGKGKRLICYINVGAWEDWRPDHEQFPPEVLGKDYKGWPGERWLDIRQVDAFKAAILGRFDLCARLGFDAIEPDNIDGYTNDTGFPLTAEDQLRYNRWLAQEAHARGLGIGLRNDPDQAADLAGDFDWAMTEDCFAEGWCEAMRPFIELGKPVLAAEYTDTRLDFSQACLQAEKLKINLILKNRELDGFREVCE